MTFSRWHHFTVLIYFALTIKSPMHMWSWSHAGCSSVASWCLWVLVCMPQVNPQEIVTGLGLDCGLAMKRHVALMVYNVRRPSTKVQSFNLVCDWLQIHYLDFIWVKFYVFLDDVMDWQSRNTSWTDFWAVREQSLLHFFTFFTSGGHRPTRLGDVFYRPSRLKFSCINMLSADRQLATIWLLFELCVHMAALMLA